MMEEQACSLAALSETWHSKEKFLLESRHYDFIVIQQND
jgi:hypothetical protein